MQRHRHHQIRLGRHGAAISSTNSRDRQPMPVLERLHHPVEWKRVIERRRRSKEGG
jgi:hypothetical protein